MVITLDRRLLQQLLTPTTSIKRQKLFPCRLAGTVSNTITLAPNNVTFGTDAIEIPLYPWPEGRPMECPDQSASTIR